MEAAYQVVLSKTSSLVLGLEISMPPNFLQRVGAQSNTWAFSKEIFSLPIFSFFHCLLYLCMSLFWQRGVGVPFSVPFPLKISIWGQRWLPTLPAIWYFSLRCLRWNLRQAQSILTSYYTHYITLQQQFNFSGSVFPLS